MVISSISWRMLLLLRFNMDIQMHYAPLLLKQKKAGVDLVAAYAKYVKEYFVGTFCVSVETYNQKHLKNTAVNEGSSDWLWWFQVCTEVAYFQVAP
ncbi:hypothetical protein Golax_014541 [Gossypium laxum]|uniref:Uncharacterized protein n=1 Tax=Gossypium laxum TaxID=34288 RepID=A0A7J8ZWG8_9ROSI|nr:hypothetical protein [Gossypium laxum]